MEVVEFFSDLTKNNFISLKSNNELINCINYANSAIINDKNTYTGDAVDIALKEFLKNKNLKSDIAKKYLKYHLILNEK